MHSSGVGDLLNRKSRKNAATLAVPGGITANIDIKMTIARPLFLSASVVYDFSCPHVCCSRLLSWLLVTVIDQFVCHPPTCAPDLLRGETDALPLSLMRTLDYGDIVNARL